MYIFLSLFQFKIIFKNKKYLDTFFNISKNLSPVILNTLYSHRSSVIFLFCFSNFDKIHFQTFYCILMFHNFDVTFSLETLNILYNLDIRTIKIFQILCISDIYIYIYIYYYYS